VALFLHLSDGFLTVYFNHFLRSTVMALAKYGGIISELRGKEAGVIFSRNAYGSYMKQKVSPVNPQTALQQDQRQQMGNLAKLWATLTAGEKAAWDNLGAQVTRVNRFGDTTNYTGFALFMKCNRNILLCGQAAIVDAPSVPQISTLAITAFTADESTPNILVTFTPTPVAADEYLFCYITPNIVTGRRFVKNYYRLVKKLAAAGTSPDNVYASWNGLFGTTLILGASLFAKFKLVSSVTGFETVPQVKSCVVLA
jgi:hypothetical protein